MLPVITLGYRIEGPERNYCQANATWLHDLPPLCSIIHCPAPRVSNHLTWLILTSSADGNDTHIATSNETSMVLGTQLQAFCSTGYELISINDTITCLPTQKWDISPSSALCDPVRCPQLNVTNGYKEGTSVQFRSSVRITCDRGYRIDNSSSSIVTCLASGAWDTDRLTCEPVICNDPPQLVNGHVVMSDRTYNTTAIYECDSGYKLTGSTSTLCTESGKWVTSLVPTCVKVYCQHPGKINHGQIYGRDVPVCDHCYFHWLNLFGVFLSPHICL